MRNGPVLGYMTNNRNPGCGCSIEGSGLEPSTTAFVPCCLLGTTLDCMYKLSKYVCLNMYVYMCV